MAIVGSLMVGRDPRKKRRVAVSTPSTTPTVSLTTVTYQDTPVTYLSETVTYG